MPVRGFKKPDPVSRRIRVQLSDGQHRRLAEMAEAARISQSEYVRTLIDSAIRGAPAPKKLRPKPKSETKLELVEIHTLAMQVKKLGTNVNQLAKQANEGLVPIRRDEIEAVLKRHERLLTAAILYFERVL